MNVNNVLMRISCWVIVYFTVVAIVMGTSLAMANIYWPMFQAATSGSGSKAHYDIRVPADHATIQGAINAAKEGDVILVADGVYTGPGNKEIWFNKPVIIRSENGPSKTIIDCEGSGRAFIFHNDSGKSGQLDGFTIKNGKAAWINGAGSWGGGGGGGIIIINASPVIKNCIITNCVATSDEAAFGAGIMISGSRAVIKNCTISNNIIALPLGGDPASNPQGGAGIVIMNGSTPIISGCTITGNKTTGWSTGGGIYVKGSSPIISNCIISYNESNINYPVDDTLSETEYSVSNSGGISYREFSGGLIENTTISHNKSQERAGLGAFQSSPTVRNCIIEYNEATVDGGGGVGLYWNSNAQFFDTIIRNNRAEDVNSVNNVYADPYGAGISVWNFHPSETGPSFIRCIIENNQAVGAGSAGGGINFYGTSATVSGCIIRNNSADNRAGISISAASKAIIKNSLIVGNISNEYGGGISCYFGADAVITNNTVVDNVANNKSGKTGWTSSLLSFQSDPIVTNTIFWGNNIPGLVVNASAPVITYSNIEGGWAGAGNISINPLFAGAGDFHLTAGSPGINSGNNDALEIGQTDLDGNTRVQDGTVDLGAYEL
ncbi:MAG: right-handed parallel beta-helix repeat-containing protein [Desulfocapsa sp.]|nr:right-handed parallel beta-helix repeat-containing protein [Desulfocapsa sp.]